MAAEQTSPARPLRSAEFLSRSSECCPGVSNLRRREMQSSGPLSARKVTATRAGIVTTCMASRLKDSVTVAMALADMKAIARQLEIQYPDANRGVGAWVQPLSEVFVKEEIG